MKLEIKGPRGLHFVAENPDEPLEAVWRDKIRKSLAEEFAAFIEECAVATRNLAPGEHRVLESKPIRVEISRLAVEEWQASSESKP